MLYGIERSLVGQYVTGPSNRLFDVRARRTMLRFLSSLSKEIIE